jgi:membrane associated rhomboid family serine protease
MIPIRDINPSKTYPIVNYSLIAINILVFMTQLLESDPAKFNFYYGLVPARYTTLDISSHFSFGQQIFSFLSFMFLHGGFVHIIGNMWSLYVFGDNIEDRLGHFRYLAFYILCGIASGMSHLLFNFHSKVPVIGASGAISGVMGAYFVLFPRAKILTLIPIIFIPWLIELPAFIFLGFWFVFQFLNAAGSGGAGIAWWAHIGGFISGIIFLKLFEIIPSSGFTEKAREVTARKTTNMLQVIRPLGPMDDANLYATIRITSHEALMGTSKIVNIPWGFQNRLVKVIIPEGVREGNMVRVRGFGKIMPDGGRGDLMLKVLIQEV